MKNFFIITLLFCFSFSIFATPKKIEMIFLSPPKTASLIDLIDNLLDQKKYKSIAQNELANCLPMGDGCFHPQLGYIENKQIETNKANKPKLVKDEEIKLKTFNAVETSVVNCDKGNYFDIYCGQASNKVQNFDTEVWFDISSSLKQVDYNKIPDLCARRTFLEKVVTKCKGKVDFSVYNTSIKQVGDYSSVCMAYGTNDESRLVKWMKNSSARRLLLVTDIDEMSTEMKDFLQENGAKIIGDGVKSFTAADLIDYANDFIKDCK